MRRVSIGELLDLRKLQKTKCQVCHYQVCHYWVQTSWRVCLDCGEILQQEATKRHYVWGQVGDLGVPESKQKGWKEILADSFAKAFSYFRSVNIFLTTDNPDAFELGGDFTRVFVIAEDKSFDYPGIAIRSSSS